MVGHANRRVAFSILLAVAFALTGCGKGTSDSPPKRQVQDAIAVVLPPFLSLDSVESEPIATGPESAKVNFKAVVLPKEDLCQVDREVEGTPRITLLKVVHATGTKVSLYGSVEARRTMDLWTLESPQIQTGLEQFGKPRGAFNAQSYVTGSSEALAALKQQAENGESQRQAKEAAIRQEEIERAAQEERQSQEEKSRRERREQSRIAIEEQQRKMAEQRKKEEEQQQNNGTAHLDDDEFARLIARLWVASDPKTDKLNIAIQMVAFHVADNEKTRTLLRGSNITAKEFQQEYGRRMFSKDNKLNQALFDKVIAELNRIAEEKKAKPG